MMKLVFTALASSACLLSAVSAAANDAKDKGATAGTFVSLDRNGDHRISRSEAGFDRKLSETFAELDTDGDGFVSAAEFSAGEEDATAIGKLTQQ